MNVISFPAVSESEPKRWFYTHTLDDGTPHAMFLYGGKSIDIHDRQGEHRRSKPYFEVLGSRVSIRMDMFEPGTTSEQQSDYERRWIEDHRPPWNDDHNEDYDDQEMLRNEILGLPSPVLVRVRFHRIKYRKHKETVAGTAFGVWFGAVGMLVADWLWF